MTRDDLDQHYDEVEKMLDAQRFPFDQHPLYNMTPKTRAFKRAGEQLNLEWQLPLLAVTFGNDGDTPSPGVPIHEVSPNELSASINEH